MKKTHEDFLRENCKNLIIILLIIVLLRIKVPKPVKLIIDLIFKILAHNPPTKLGFNVKLK